MIGAVIGLAAVPRADAAFVIDFRQGSNQNPTLGQEVWINGILNPGNSQYYEGMIVPQRLLMTNIPATAGNVHHLKFHVDATKGGIHAYDFLASWAQVVSTTNAIDPYFATHPPMTLAGLNPCGPNIGPPGSLTATCTALYTGANVANVAAPGDPFVSKDNDGTLGNQSTDDKIAGFETLFGDRILQVYSNAALSNVSITLDTPAHTTSGGAPIANSGDTGDTTIHYVLTWTSSGDQLLFTFGTHLSVTGTGHTGVSWGPGLGAAFISGGSYHASLDYLDPGTPTSISLGSQDNQIQANAVTIPAPSCGVTGPDPVCAGATGLTYTASSDGSSPQYSWSITGNGTINGGNTGSSVTVDAGSSGSFTITVAITTAGGTTSCGQTVTVNANPAPVASNNGPLCNGGALSLSATAGFASYSWTGPSAFASTAQNPTILNASPLNSGTYTVTVTDANGCTGTASTTVVVNGNPTPVAANSGPACAGSTVNLTATAGFASYSWSGPNSFASTAQNPSIASATTAASGTYTVTVTDANGCTGAASTTVVVNSNPAPTAGNNGPLCAGGAVNLTATDGFASYSWSGPNSFASALQNPSIASATSAASGTYTVTVTDANGCTGTASTTVVVNSNPVPVASNSGPVCAGSTVILSASAGFASYSWSGPNSFASTAQNPSIASATSAASGTYTVTVTDANGCTGTSSTTVVVNDNPAPVAGNDGPLCEGGTVSLTATDGFASYSWSGPNSFASTAQNPSIASATSAASGTYTVTVTDANGCSGSASTTVVVNANPTPLAGNNGPACVGGTVSLTASDGFASYSWSGPNSFASTSQNPSITSATSAASGTYTVTVTDANGCTGSASTTVVVSECAEFCTVTPGFWGSAAGGQGKFDNITAYDLLTCLLSGNPLTIGVVGTRSLTITDAACIISRFPSSGTPTALPDFGHFGSPDRTISGTNCNTTQPQIPVSNNGRFKNILLGETATLMLNERMDGDLSGFVLPASFSTVPADPGQNGTVGEPLVCVPTLTPNDDSANFGTGCNTVTRSIPAGLVGLTVNQLIVIANQALAGMNTGFTYAEINQAVTAINEGFDKCRFLGSCPASTLESPASPDATAPTEADR